LTIDADRGRYGRQLSSAAVLIVWRCMVEARPAMADGPLFFDDWSAMVLSKIKAPKKMICGFMIRLPSPGS
jgi:hypothetical protein